MLGISCGSHDIPGYHLWWISYDSFFWDQHIIPQKPSFLGTLVCILRFDSQIWKGHCMVIKPSHNFQRGLNLKLKSNLVFIVQPFTYKNLQRTMHSYNHYPGFLTTKDTLPYFISLLPHTSGMASTNNQNF